MPPILMLRFSKSTSTSLRRAHSLANAFKVIHVREMHYAADFALRVFKRDELLEIIEGAACQPPGRLQGLVQYLAAKLGQDEAFAELTDAVVAALRRRLEN